MRYAAEDASRRRDDGAHAVVEVPVPHEPASFIMVATILSDAVSSADDCASDAKSLTHDITTDSSL
jgi:hypothetical protein